MNTAGKIVVTGGSGNVGSHVVRAIAAAGFDVVNVDRVQKEGLPGTFASADVRQRDAILPVLAGAKAVCHLAEIPNLFSPMPQDQVLANNIAAGASVIQACIELKIPRLIYSSTAQVYGFWGKDSIAPPRLPVDESFPANPQNPYALGKATNEQFAQLCARTSTTSIAIFRFPWVIADQWIPTGLNNMIENTGRFADGFGTYIHASDLAMAYVQAVSDQRPGCEIYNLAAADVCSKMPLRERLKNHPEFPPLPADWPSHQSPMSCAKASAHFGYAPKWSMLAEYNRRKAAQ